MTVEWMLWCRDSYSNPGLMVLEGWLFLEFPLSPYLWSIDLFIPVFLLHCLYCISLLPYWHIFKVLCKINIIVFVWISIGMRCFQISEDLHIKFIWLRSNQHIYCFAKAAWLCSVCSKTSLLEVCGIFEHWTSTRMSKHICFKKCHSQNLFGNSNTSLTWVIYRF